MTTMNKHLSAEVVTVDLSNAAGTENAEKQICAALQSNSLTDSDYALVKMVRKMISEIVVDDEVGAKLVAEGKISREYYDATAYTSEEFKTITLDNTFGMREWADARDLMDFAGVTEEDYHISWGKGLIRGFSFNRNAVAKAVIYTLNLAGIKADGRTDYTMVDEVSTENGATNIEIENAVKRENDMPSVEKFFAAVTTEIKPHIRGKYFVQIDDNWYQQSVRENFKTLEDAVKVARIMHSELCKVSRHIYATVEARTVDLNKLWDRADDWTTFYEINSDGEKINRRETIEVISKIDNRTVEEVRNDIGRCGDNYGFYKNSAVTVENAPAEIDSNAEIIACLDDYFVNSDNAAEVEIENAAVNFGTKFEVGKIYSLGRYIMHTPYKFAKIIKREGKDKVLIECIDGHNEYCRVHTKKDNSEQWLQAKAAKFANVAVLYSDYEITAEEVNHAMELVTKQSFYYELTAERAAEFFADYMTTVEKNPLKEKIQAAELAAENSNAKRHAFLKNFYLKMCGEYYPAEGYVDYVTDYAKIIYRKVGENYVEDATAFAELEEIECNLKAQYREVAKLKNIASKADILKAKIAEQKSRPRKSIIYWSGTFDEMKISEIFTLQKDFKKFLKIGQLELAESIFNQIKILCKNYREAAA